MLLKYMFTPGPALRIAPLLSPVALLGAPWPGSKSLAASLESEFANTPWRDPFDWTGLNCSSASFGWFFLLVFLVVLSMESGQQTGVQTYP
jgi:hypothetical protein